MPRDGEDGGGDPPCEDEEGEGGEGEGAEFAGAELGGWVVGIVVVVGEEDVRHDVVGAGVGELLL